MVRCGRSRRTGWAGFAAFVAVAVAVAPGCAEAEETRKAFGPDPLPSSGAAGCYLQILKNAVDVDGFCADRVVIQVGSSAAAGKDAYEVRAYDAVSYPNATVSGARALNVDTSITGKPQTVQVSPCLKVPKGGHVAVANPSGPILDSMDRSDTSQGGYWNLFTATTNVTGETTELVGSFTGVLGWRVEGVVTADGGNGEGSPPASGSVAHSDSAAGRLACGLLAASAVGGLFL